VEYFQRYYDDLSKRQLVHNDYWIIVIIEAAWYCKSRNVDYIRFNRLKELSNEALSRITDGVRYSLGGTFESIIYSHRCKRFLHVVKINKKETRIYPNISLIEREVKAKQAENFDNKVLRHTYICDPFPRTRPITEPSVVVSESLTRQTSKTRSLSDSVPVLERLGMVVTRAKSKEE
jgi:hypothetical protein